MPSLEEILARLDKVQNRSCVCGYCGADLFDYDVIPPVHDERGWGKLAQIHYDDCEWLQRKAFQLPLETLE